MPCFMVFRTVEVGHLAGDLWDLAQSNGRRYEGRIFYKRAPVTSLRYYMRRILYENPPTTNEIPYRIRYTQVQA